MNAMGNYKAGYDDLPRLNGIMKYSNTTKHYSVKKKTFIINQVIRKIKL